MGKAKKARSLISVALLLLVMNPFACKLSNCGWVDRPCNPDDPLSEYCQHKQYCPMDGLLIPDYDLASIITEITDFRNIVADFEQGKTDFAPYFVVITMDNVVLSPSFLSLVTAVPAGTGTIQLNAPLRLWKTEREGRFNRAYVVPTTKTIDQIVTFLRQLKAAGARKGQITHYSIVHKFVDPQGNAVPPGEYFVAHEMGMLPFKHITDKLGYDWIKVRPNPRPVSTR